MKTETQIADHDIELFKYCKMGEAKYYRMILNEHKALCQRWLDFLDELFKEGGITDFSANKITDLKQAISKYKENGI